MLGEGELSLVDSLEQGRLSATVLSEKTIAAAVGNFHSGVVEEDFTVENKRG